MKWKVFRTTSEAEDAWRSLESRSTSAYVCQTFDWNRAVFEALDGAIGQRPFIVLGPGILIPLAIRYKFGVRILEFLSTDINGYNAPLVADDWTGSFPHEAVISLARPDVVQFNNLPECLVQGRPHPLLPHPEARLGRLGWSAILDPSTFILRNRRRRNLLIRRSAEPVTFGKGNPSDVDIMLAQRAQKYGDTHPFKRAFAAAYHAIAELPTGHFTTLRSGSTVLAANLSTIYGGQLYGVSMSHINEGPYAPLGTGQVLLLYLAEWALANGVREFNLNTGGSPYKSEWCKPIETFNCRFPVSLRGRAAYFVRRSH
jgi:CelD/BcsL family acetyltransferase involved in cellulose biosynthesis